MKHRAIAWLLSIVLLCCALFGGCSAPTEDLAHAKNDYPLTVNGVTLETAPAKVVVLSPALADIVLALGSSYELKLTGRGADCTQKALDSLPACGTVEKPNATAIFTCRADLVLTDRELPEETAQQLKKEGVTTIVLPVATDRTTLQANFEKVGAILAGAKLGYARAKNQVEGILMDLDDITRTIPEVDRSVRVAFLLDEKGTMVPRDSLGGLLMECAGGINIAPASDEAPLTEAQLRLADPQIFFCPEGCKEAIQSAAMYQSLNVTVVELPRTYMEWQGNTVVEATLAMAKVMHPEYLSDGKK